MKLEYADGEVDREVLRDTPLVIVHLRAGKYELARRAFTFARLEGEVAVYVEEKGDSQ